MTWRWVDRRALLLLHADSLSEHGGAPGLRDPGLLDSALNRPLHLAAYGSPDWADLAACYGVAIAKNHAFVDGNKRAALLAIGLFIALNGRRMAAGQAEATVAMLDVAAGEMGEDELAAWLRAHSRPRDGA